MNNFLLSWEALGLQNKWRLNIWLLSHRLNLKIHGIKIGIILTYEFDWSHLRLSDLDERVWRSRTNSGFTLLAKVKVVSLSASVSDTNNRSSFTSITDMAVMSHLVLFFSLFGQVLQEKLLILLGTVTFDLGLQDLVEVFEELVVKLAGGITFLARKALLVDLGAVASEAVWKILHLSVLISLVHIFWSENHATNFLLVSNHVLLASLRLGIDLCVAHYLFELCLSLRTSFIGYSSSSNLLLRSVLGLSVASKTVLLSFMMNQVLNHISGVS